MDVSVRNLSKNVDPQITDSIRFGKLIFRHQRPAAVPKAIEIAGRSVGVLRETKEYVMQDGDAVDFRFNV